MIVAARFGRSASVLVLVPVPVPVLKSVSVYSRRPHFDRLCAPDASLRVVGDYGKLIWAVRSGRWPSSADVLRSWMTYVFVGSTLAVKSGLMKVMPL